MKASDFDSSEEDMAEEAPTPLHVSWLPLSPVYSSVFLGLCSLPGCRFKDVRRNLQKDIEELKTYGTQDIFVFCTRGELLKYRVPNLIDAYQQHGIFVHHHPIPDGDAPDIDKCCRILEELRSCLESNRKMIIHCYGGLGRSCLAFGCADTSTSNRQCQKPERTWGDTDYQGLHMLSELTYELLYIITLAKGCGLTETAILLQYNFLHDFREKLAAHLAAKDTVLRSVSR